MKRIISILAIAVLCAAPAFACTTAIVGAKASKTGRPLMWKQRDSGKTENAYAYDDSGKYAFTSVFSATDSLHKSSYGGVNEAGFALVNNYSGHIQGPGKIKNGKIMTLALKTCATIADFENLLRGLDENHSVAANFGVMDASGAAAYIEFGQGVFKRYDVPEDGWLVRTNYSLAGPEENGNGYARYQTAHYVMSHHKGKFSPEDLISGLGRCFRNEVMGSTKPLLYSWDEDFIPRPTTAGSVCIEGMIPGDKPGSTVMWVAPGYTPASYSIPVWPAAGREIAGPVAAGENGNSPMNEKAEVLRKSTHDLTRDAAGKYINLKKARALVKRSEKAEAVEMKAGRILVDKFRAEGFDPDAVRAYNAEAENRFKIWESQ